MCTPVIAKRFVIQENLTVVGSGKLVVPVDGLSHPDQPIKMI